MASAYEFILCQMTWSHSRIGSFKDCRYRFLLHYLYDCEEEDMFYASYGKFVHEILEKYYKGELPAGSLKYYFLVNFSDNVTGKRPEQNTLMKYIHAAEEYLDVKNFTPVPYKVLAVEEMLDFQISGQNFVGIVDLLCEDESGDLIIVDHKSRDLKPRSKRKKPTQSDVELDQYLEQLYLYSEAIKQKYGRYPKWLCFNCFKNGVFIKEPFSEERCKQVVNDTAEMVQEIVRCEDFYPNVDYFGCKWICGFKKDCVYAGGD